jgi:hypothetical protein
VVGRLGIRLGAAGTYARGGSRLVDLLNGWMEAALAMTLLEKFGMRCWMRMGAVGSGRFCSCMSRATDEPRARPWLGGRDDARPALMMPRWTGTAGKPRAPSPTSSGEGGKASWAADCCEKLSAAGTGGKHLPLPPVLMPLPPGPSGAGRGKTPPSEDCIEAEENLPAMVLSPAGALSSAAALDRR